MAGLAWVTVALLAYFSPALWDGFSFGPADIGHQLSYLTYVPTHLPNLGVYNHLNGDVITQEVPWATLDWRAVHHGQLPLWNSYSATGMPLLLNWESAPFSLPTLVSYLFPLKASYLVEVFFGLLVAGTGTYSATRAAGAGPLGAAFAGCSFMLSGPISGWAGWAVSRPLVWAGWLLTGAILCWRPGHRLAGAVLSTLSSAFAVYGGFPETLALLAGGLALVLLVSGVATRLKGAPGQLPALVRLGGAYLAGAALSAPLWLPGLSVLRQSARASEPGGSYLALSNLALLVAQGYDGLPVRTASWFGPSNYYESAAYVGAIGLALAVLAVLVAWRRPLVTALATTAVGSFVAVYSPLAGPVLSRLGLRAVAPTRALAVSAFCLSVLAGVGTSHLVRHWRSPVAQSRLLACAGAGLAAVAYLWLSAPAKGLAPGQLAARRHSLLWPGAMLAGLALFALAAWVATGPLPARVRQLAGQANGRLLWPARRPHPAAPHQRWAAPRQRWAAPRDLGRLGCLLLLGAQTAYLVWAGIGLNSYSTSPFPVNSAVAKLQRLVGDSLVALDGPNPADVTEWTGTGLYPEVNVGYGVRELAVHDPVAPAAYFKTWPVASATAAAGLGNNVFVPSVSSAALARHYGASFVLASQGRVPTGASFVTKLGKPPYSLYLYSVPGAAQFSFAAGSAARVLSATQTGNATWSLAVSAPQASALTLRLTYVPGWHVAADGRRLPVHRVEGLFAGVTVPAGARSVAISYWPPLLSLGFALALAAIGAVLLLGVFCASFSLRRVLVSPDGPRRQ